MLQRYIDSYGFELFVISHKNGFWHASGVLREFYCGGKGIPFKLAMTNLMFTEKNCKEKDLDLSRRGLINQTEVLDTKCGELVDATTPCNKP